MTTVNLADIWVRRCWHVLCEPVQTVQLDTAALFSGSGKPLLETVHKWNVLAAHLDRPVEVDSGQLQMLGELDHTHWSALEALPAAAKALFDAGLLLAEDDTRDCALRDLQLRDGYWWGPAAVVHAQSRWLGQDSVQRLAEQGLDRLDGLIGALGTPPDSGGQTAGAIPLPMATDSALERLLASRVSCRNFDGSQSLALADLSTVLWAGMGERAVVEHGSGARFAKKGSPSAGGLHPVEAYLLLRNVAGLEDGLYHYQAQGHRIMPMRAEPALGQDWLATATGWLAGQYWFANAQALVVFAPRYDRLQWKYRNHSKAYRAAILDVGHLSQTLYLAATQAGLGAFVTAAINECDVEQDLGLQPFGDGPLAIAGFGVRAAYMETAELDPAGAIWQPAGD